MVRMITFLAASTALAGCMTTPAVEMAPPPSIAEAVSTPTPPVPAAELGSYGFDAAGMDTAVLALAVAGHGVFIWHAKQIMLPAAAGFLYLGCWQVLQ